MSTQIVDRPISITLVCLFGGFVAIVAFFLAFIPLSTGGWYPIYFMGLAVVQIWSIWGIWTMMRWGVWLYGAKVFANYAVLMSLGGWSVLHLIVPGLTLAAAISHYKDMK